VDVQSSQFRSMKTEVTGSDDVGRKAGFLTTAFDHP
jgi:hypothetical protein